MPVRSTLEPLAQEITKMAKGDDDDIADISRQQDIVRRVLFNDALDGVLRVVLRRIPIVLIRTMAKLGVHGRENLLGRGRALGIRETICVIALVLVQNGVF